MNIDEETILGFYRYILERLTKLDRLVEFLKVVFDKTAAAFSFLIIDALMHLTVSELK